MPKDQPSQKHFEELPFDPESTGRADPEKLLKIREAEQAHHFRAQVFFLGSKACLIIFFLWVILVICTWPFPGMSTTMVVLLGAKFAIVTGVLLALAISLMRFAMRCAHHDDKDDTAGLLKSSLEVLKELGKLVKG